MMRPYNCVLLFLLSSTASSLGVLNGQQLLGMTKDEIRTVCPEEGGKVFFHLQGVKSAIAVSVVPCNIYTFTRQDKSVMIHFGPYSSPMNHQAHTTAATNGQRHGLQFLFSWIFIHRSTCRFCRVINQLVWMTLMKCWFLTELLYVVKCITSSKNWDQVINVHCNLTYNAPLHISF